MTTLPYFTFNDVISTQNGLFIIKKNIYNGAERDVTITSIPGRSGDLIIDNKRYKNVTVEYECGLLTADLTEQKTKTDAIKAWLGATPNYYKLSDSYDSTSYRMGVVKGGFEFSADSENYGRTKIRFNCKPYKYLNSGDAAVEFASSGTVTNPGLTAKPYIKLTGSGDMLLTIGSASYQFRNVDGYIEIDSEAMQCYKGTINCNSKMYTESFPVIESGEQSISCTNGTAIKIIPRWCKL